MSQIKALTDQEILTLVRSEYDAAEQWSEELAEDRETALDYYNGEPLGNEEEGRSQVRSTDVFDVVEWMMPALVRTFAGDDELIAFEGLDDKQATTATKLAHHVFFVENDGFRNIHDSIKDGLLCKVGALKRRWCERKEPVDRDYNGLSEVEVALLFAKLEQESGNGAGISIIGQEVVEGPDGQPRYNVRVRVLRVIKKTEIEAIPPEELKVPRQCRVISDATRYVAHELAEGKSRSDLIAEGVDPALVLDLPKVTTDYTNERSARYSSYSDGQPAGNAMMEMVEYVEHYVLADVDGDGIAERRLIVTSGDKILRNEVLAGLPISAWSPIRMPHSAIGRSIADPVLELERISTTLLRGMMDNIYSVNAGGRYEVVAGEVNLDDLLTQRPGGAVRVKSRNAIGQLPVEYIGDKAAHVMELVRTMREERTGVNRHNQGVNAESLHQTATGAMALLNQADQRIELIARLYAEFCLKPCFAGILDDLIRYQDDAKQIKVAGKVLEIDPAMFKERMGIRVKVGSGNMRKQEKVTILSALLEQQTTALQGGAPVVTVANIYNTLSDMAELSGLPADRYWIDPRSPQGQMLSQPKQPQPNPLAEAEIVKGQVRMAEQAQQDQFKREERMLTHAERMTEMELKYSTNVPGSSV